MDKPQFVRKTWPPPDTEVSFGCYTRMVLERIITPYPRNNLGSGAEVIVPSNEIAITIIPEVLSDEMRAGGFPGRVDIIVDGESVPLTSEMR